MELAAEKDAGPADRLAAGSVLTEPLALVVAHPDDETIGIGSRLARLRRLRLIHLTDGAPRDMRDAMRAGFASREHYARARRQELDAALRIAGAAPEARIACGIADQETAAHLVALARRLAGELRGLRAVITHSYEGGHPDHDAAAFAVHAAGALLRRRGERAPAVLEFASYHLRAGELRWGVFWPDEEHPEVLLTLTAAERARKSAALASFETQRSVLGAFDPGRERIRTAPAYDFTAPPPPGTAAYDLWGWHVTSGHWREQARHALGVLGLEGRL